MSVGKNLKKCHEKLYLAGNHTSNSVMNRNQIDSRTKTRSSELMEEEVLYWTRFNYAISSFCLEQTLTAFEPEKVVCSLVGQGMTSFLIKYSKDGCLMDTL